MTLSFSLRIQNLLDPDVLRERYEIVNSIFSYTRICLPKWENQVFKILEIRPETLIKWVLWCFDSDPLGRSYDRPWMANTKRTKSKKSGELDDPVRPGMYVFIKYKVYRKSREKFNWLAWDLCWIIPTLGVWNLNWAQLNYRNIEVYGHVALWSCLHCPQLTKLAEVFLLRLAFCLLKMLWWQNCYLPVEKGIQEFQPWVGNSCILLVRCQ